MSVFMTPMTMSIPQADLLCAMLLLAILCMKIITMKQESPVLTKLNRALSLGLYPMALIFGLFMVQWIAL
ncbi:MAG: hypothetical protein AAF846_13845 [Chloroflexota bacterium]